MTVHWGAVERVGPGKASIRPPFPMLIRNGGNEGCQLVDSLQLPCRETFLPLRSAGNYWGSRRPLRRQSHRSLPLKARLSGVPMSCGLSVVLLPSLRGSQACSRVIYCFAGLSVFWGSFQPMKRKRPVSRSLFTYSEAFHLLYEGSSVHAQYLSRLALYSVSFIEGLQNQGLFEF